MNRDTSILMRTSLFLSLTLAWAAWFGPSLVAQEAAPAVPAAQQEKVPQVEEKATDHMYDQWVDVKDGKATRRLQLAGLGVRKKTLFRVKVYSFGFYLEADKAAKAVQPLLGRKMKEMMRDSKLDDALLDGNYAKRLRLVMARSVDADDMTEAFKDSLQPRIRNLVKKMSKEEQAAAETARLNFEKVFKEPAKEKQVIEFTWLPGGRLLTSIDGKAQPEIKNEVLCKALFHIYLGNDPISESGKEAILKGLPAALKAGEKKQ